MTEIKCERIIGGRAKDGKPSPCGRPACAFYMVGGLGSVPTVLCAKHAEEIRNDGYRLVPLDIATFAEIRGFQTTNDEAPQSGVSRRLTNAVSPVSELGSEG